MMVKPSMAGLTLHELQRHLELFPGFFATQFPQQTNDCENDSLELESPRFRLFSNLYHQGWPGGTSKRANGFWAVLPKPAPCKIRFSWPCRSWFHKTQEGAFLALPQTTPHQSLPRLPLPGALLHSQSALVYNFWVTSASELFCRVHIIWAVRLLCKHFTVFSSDKTCPLPARFQRKPVQPFCSRSWLTGILLTGLSRWCHKSTE